MQLEQQTFNVEKYRGQLTCIQCGYGCGYRRDTPFGGVSYGLDEEVPEDVEIVERNGEKFIPVDENDTCIYLVKFDNGFTKCGIHEKKPKTCRLFYCLPEQKARQLQIIVDELKNYRY